MSQGLPATRSLVITVKPTSSRNIFTLSKVLNQDLSAVGFSSGMKSWQEITTWRVISYVFGSRVVEQFGGSVRGAGHVARGA